MGLGNRESRTSRGNSTSEKVFWDEDTRVSWRAEGKEPVERQTGRLKKGRKKTNEAKF